MLTGLISVVGLWLIVQIVISVIGSLAGLMMQGLSPYGGSPATGPSVSTTEWLGRWGPWAVINLVAGAALIIYAEPIACLLSPVRRQPKCPACRYSLTAITEPRCPECGLELSDEFLTPQKAAGSERP